MLCSCLHEMLELYQRLPRPPWEPDGVPWGPQPVAGHATTINGDDSFVGEHGDLLWRALTETDHNGLSPLKATITMLPGATWAENTELLCAAALYDDTAQHQLTHGLFDVGDQSEKRWLQKNVVDAFTRQLDPADGECQWTVEQQHRLRGFIETVRELEP